MGECLNLSMFLANGFSSFFDVGGISVDLCFIAGGFDPIASVVYFVGLCCYYYYYLLLFWLGCSTEFC